MSLFNGSKLKGMTLKIQDAKPDYKQSQKTLSNLSPLIPKKCRHRNRDTMFAEDMSLVADNNIDGRKVS
ncbi:hypothetical protein C2G38_2104088 [Gigaspora rosea]|uniref:Uncharacterized protein n=1 Tax=Gigaspora rosea TaxID=44941 RepID=A0A397UPM5_9GLOM|nr:hypothetical protein C2G38_2104088 [Gigaspora rosea]